MGRSAKRKRQNKVASSLLSDSAATNVSDSDALISGPKLRAKLCISAVTLWRWRHKEASDFPPAKVINGRLYFPLDAVTDWIAQQPETA